MMLSLTFLFEKGGGALGVLLGAALTGISALMYNYYGFTDQIFQTMYVLSGIRAGNTNIKNQKAKSKKQKTESFSLAHRF